MQATASMGSFWTTTDYGLGLLMMEESEMDLLLKNEETTLEDILDCDEVLQQCSNKNDALIDFLCKDTSLTKLINFITKNPSENINSIAQERRLAYQQKYPQSQSHPHPHPHPHDSNANNTDSSSTIILDPFLYPKTSLSSVPEKSDINPNNNTNTDQNNQDQSSKKKKKKNKKINASNKKNSIKASDAKLAPLMRNLLHNLPPPPPLPSSDETNKNETNSSTTSGSAKHSGDDSDDNDPELPDLAVSKTEEKPSGDVPVVVTDGSNVNLIDGAVVISNTDIVQEKNKEINIETQREEEASSTENDSSDEFEEMPEELKEKIQLKFPRVAGEIFNCQIGRMLDIILEIQNPYLGKIFEFIIDREVPIDAQLTNYWRSCIVALIRRNPKVMFEYIKNRGDLILKNLVIHVRDQAIMELLIAIGWDPAIEGLQETEEVSVWMHEHGLINKLINLLLPTEDSDAHSAASYTLVDIVAKANKSPNLLLFNELVSPQSVDRIVMECILQKNAPEIGNDEHVVNNRRSAMLESMGVLLALLHHYPNLKSENSDNSSLFQSSETSESSSLIKSTDNLLKRKSREVESMLAVPPPPPPPPLDTTQSNEKVTTDAPPPAPQKRNSKNVSVNPLAALALQKEMTKPPELHQARSLSDIEESKTKKEENENENIPFVISYVCDHLNDFKALLEKPLGGLSELSLSFIKLQSPLGPVRHKIVDLIVALMRTPCKKVSDALESLELIEKCVELFFKYPWNNLLHASVEHIIQMILSGQCSVLQKILFEKSQLLDRILEAQNLSQDHFKQHHIRLGYMGHLTRISNTIVEYQKYSEHIQKYCTQHTRWLSFVEKELMEENNKLNTQLGGHRPNALGIDDGNFMRMGNMGNEGKKKRTLGLDSKDSEGPKSEHAVGIEDEMEDAFLNQFEEMNNNTNKNKDKKSIEEKTTSTSVEESSNNQKKTESENTSTKEDNEFESWDDFDVFTAGDKKNNADPEKNNTNSEQKKTSEPVQENASNANDSSFDDFDNWDADFSSDTNKQAKTNTDKSST